MNTNGKPEINDSDCNRWLYAMQDQPMDGLIACSVCLLSISS